MNSNKTSPPPLARWLLKRLLRYEYRSAVVGDFEEIYREIFEEHDRRHALLWYWRQVIKSTPSFIANSFLWSVAMFKSYFKVALRNMQKHKLFSFINISGLAIGIACCLLVLLFIQNELSYDMFNENADHIYKVGTKMLIRDSWRLFPNSETASPVGPAMVDEFPEVVNTVRVTSDVAKKVLFRDKDNSFYEEGFYAADPNFFEFFDFPLISGDPKTVLDDPHAIVITEEIAQKYFGEEDPIGKTFSATGYRSRNQINYEFTVTGVMKNIPENSHLQFNILGSLLGAESVYDLLNWDFWPVASLHTYVLLRENSSSAELQSKLWTSFEKNLKRREGSYEQRLFIEPLSAVHRTPEVTRYIHIIFAIALVILLIACINFTNLSTARSLTRAKEIGIRKVVGANRFQLIKQFIGESVLFSLCALVIALLLAKLLLPVFNTLVGKNLQLEIFRDPLFIAASVGIALFVGVLSGSYPALFISAFQPVSVFKGQSKSGPRKYHFKNILVIFQYAVSVFFIIGTIITYSQMHFILHKDLGFDREQIVNISLSEKLSKDQLETIKYRIAENPDIANVTYSSSLPFSGRLNLFAFPEEVTEPDLKKEILMDVIYCDYDFIETLGIEIIEGRDFSREHPADLAEAFIINEPGAKAYNMDNPLGGKIKYAETGGGFKTGTVIGVMKNFHNESFHREIRPMVLAIKPPQFNDYYKFISVKLRPGKIPETIEFLRKTMLTFSQDDPFEYSFFDERINALYESERHLMTLFIVVSIMAIFIACLGLFGLAAFSAERRTKEIGIRKTLGATVPSIAAILSWEFLKWVIAANVIAWPIAYLVMDRWLQNFAYRIDIGLKIFALAGFTTLLIALITISAQVIKAAIANPVDSLRYE